MLAALYFSKAFEELPLKTRQRAAWHARQCAMRHWEFWAAVVVLILLIVGFAVASGVLGFGDSEAVGAACGFIIGFGAYGWTLRRIAMPYYVKFLEKVKEPRIHTVRAGESLETIASRFQISIQDIAALNRGVDLSHIFEVQTIRVAKTVMDSGYVYSKC